MDAAVLDEQKKRQLSRRRTQERRTDCPEPDLFDLANSQRRVREIIEHLQNRLLPVYK